MRRRLPAICVALVALVATAPAALAAFPYGTGAPHYHTAPGVVPNDLSGAANDWKFAATAESGSPLTGSATELFGVRGSHVADADPSVDTAWLTTTGRPDVTIASLDSGIRWNDGGAASDLRRKVRLNKGELPVPEQSNGADCAQYDCNNDDVFDVDDYAADPRINLSDPRRAGPAGVITPEDVTIAFSDGSDGDSNGFTDDIAGWDFLDNDNDPYDDVQYDHGTGQAKGSNAEADNGGQAGSCPSCTVIPMRVGDSFIADSNAFAQAVIYAVDNDVLVVQEALGTLNASSLARKAIDYAYDHGVAVIASAADEAAQHHNWPSNFSHTIVVNSVNKYNTAFTPYPSYLQFNGCTNFSSHVTLSIPSSTCSSNATGLGAGDAGLVYSAALNANDNGDLGPSSNCQRVNGDPCLITPNEVRQIMASGTISNVSMADDVNFATQPEPSCSPAPSPGCTDPNQLQANATANHPTPSPLANSKAYPARKGYDEFYGYGRANMAKAVQAAATGNIPPEAEITSPSWYAQVDPTQPTAAIAAHVFARGTPYSCRVEVAPGSEPNNGLTTDVPPGDFKVVPSSWCDGTTHTSAFDGTVAQLDLNDLESRFPASVGSFNGPEPPPGPPNFNGRPNTEPYGFTVRVVAIAPRFSGTLTGEDRRNLYLHRDQDMLPGFPKQLTGDGESSPTLADLDGDNQNELIFATADGRVHAWHRDGSELAGWPVHTDSLPLHTGGHAFASGEVSTSASYTAVLSSASVGDIDHDGIPEIAASDMGGKLYVWEPDGTLRFKREANVNYSGKPLSPFVNVRRGKRYRTQHGFLGSPVLADLDGNGGNLEIIDANMDRHVYAWHADGSGVDGFPVLVVDRSKISAIDPQTHAPTFNSGIGAEWNQGAIVDTTAVGDLTGDGKPEIVIGTNEEYEPSADGGVNAGNLNTASLALIAASGQLDFANSRLYAIKPGGDPGGPTVTGPSPFLTGWPKKLAFINKELLPVVGEGVTGSPVIGTVNCTTGGNGPKVGAISAGGPAYLFNPDGSSCYGRSLDDQGRQQDNAMQTDFPASTDKYDTPAIPAVGHPTFGTFAGGTSFLVPATGVIRALDLAANEYQGGQDFISAYDPTTGQFRSGFPSPVNDLQFITGPSVGDLDGLPGEEVVGGTASLDLYGMNQAGAPFDPSAWPKLTSDWTVANPVIGSLGTNDTESSARKVVVSLTRAGAVLAYDVDAPACSPSSWPRFHHDNATSGDFSRDAVSPGKPYEVSVSGNTVSFKAPGDDLLCGNADHYQVVQSNGQITPSNFSAQQPVAGAPAPAAPGTTQSINLPANHKANVAIRAVDEQGNVGRPVILTLVSLPIGASPLRVSLVPAFKSCETGDVNAAHGQPLGFGSCASPAPVSQTVRVGPNSLGFARMVVCPNQTFSAFCTSPGTALPLPDVRLTGSIRDVKCAQSLPSGQGACSSPGADYNPNGAPGPYSDLGNGALAATPPCLPTGQSASDCLAGADLTELAELPGATTGAAGTQFEGKGVRITDQDNGPSGDEFATTIDIGFPIPLDCAPTAATDRGSSCGVNTTMNALAPGVVGSGNAAVWQLGQLEIVDSGPDGTRGNADDELFEVQGVFVP